LLGIEVVLFIPSLKLFPNPASNLVTIKKPKSLIIKKITIFNMLGQNLGTLLNQEKMDIGKLSSGLHLIKLKTNLGTFHKSLLIH
jgi:hypothetical protein